MHWKCYELRGDEKKNTKKTQNHQVPVPHCCTFLEEMALALCQLIVVYSQKLCSCVVKAMKVDSYRSNLGIKSDSFS